MSTQKFTGNTHSHLLVYHITTIRNKMVRINGPAPNGQEQRVRYRHTLRRNRQREHGDVMDKNLEAGDNLLLSINERIRRLTEREVGLLLSAFHSQEVGMPTRRHRTMFYTCRLWK